MKMIVQIDPKTETWLSAELETRYRTIYRVPLDLPEADFDFDDILSMVSHLTGIDLINADKTAHYNTHDHTYAVQVHHAPKYRESLLRRAKEGVFFMITACHAFDYDEAREGLGYFLSDLDELWLEDQDALGHEIMIDALELAIRFYVDEAGDNLLTEDQAVDLILSKESAQDRYKLLGRLIAGAELLDIEQ